MFLCADTGRVVETVLGGEGCDLPPSPSPHTHTETNRQTIRERCGVLREAYHAPVCGHRQRETVLGGEGEEGVTSPPPIPTHTH